MSDPNQVVIHNLQGPGLLDFAPDAETLAQRIAEARPVALPMLKGPPPHPKKNHELEALVGAGSPSSAHGPIAGEPPLQGNGPSDTSPTPLSMFPFVAVGRLYATRRDAQGNSITTFGTAWSCGGAVAMTAGHCVFTQADGWPTSVAFVPHFDPTQPLGNYWTGLAIASVSGWVNSHQQTDADYQYDLAVIRFSGPLEPQVGKIGWNTNPCPRCTALGFPSPSDTGGQSMRASTGAAFSQGFNSAYNDLPGGCSGGPWMAWSANPPVAIGLTSHRHNNDPNVAYSPPFGQAFQNLISLW